MEETPHPSSEALSSSRRTPRIARAVEDRSISGYTTRTGQSARSITALGTFESRRVPLEAFDPTTMRSASSGGHSGDRLRGVRECWMRLDTDGLSAAISCSLASNDPVGPAAVPEAAARRGPRTVVPADVRASSRCGACPRRAHDGDGPAHGAGPARRVGCPDDDILKHGSTGPGLSPWCRLPPFRAGSPGHPRIGGPANACCVRRSDQDWHVRRFGQLLADARVKR